MKFHKRPMDESELAFTMSQNSVLVMCDCFDLAQCNCPAIPTHMIQSVQENEGRTDVHLNSKYN